MDPLSAIIIGLIWAALRAPSEAGRSMRNDYRARAGRWNNRAETWMGGRGRGERRVAGYDRDGRAYRRGDRNRKDGRRRGNPGWRTDSRAWTGPEGRARVARGLRPRAIRSGIIAGALAYTAVFGLGVASRGFARGLRGGYRMGKLHYQGKRTMRTDPTVTVTQDTPDGPADPNAETAWGEFIDGEVVEPHEPDAPKREAITPPIDQAPATEPNPPAGWLITVLAPGSDEPVGQITVTDPDQVDARLAVIAQTPGLRAEVRELADLPEDSRPRTAAGSSTNPGGNPLSSSSHHTEVNGGGNDVVTNSLTGNVINGRVQMGGGSGSQVMVDGNPVSGSNVGIMARSVNNSSVNMSVGPDGATVTTGGVTRHTPAGGGSAVSVFSGGGSIAAPLLMEGANYDAHLHNLNVLAKEARAEYSSAELTLASASAARQRAEHAMAAVEQMAAGLAAQDFGELHVGNMASLHEMLARQVEQSRTAERAAQESLATSEHLIELCTSAAAVFQRDHGQLAEAHAAAPHAAKTREAYQPM